MALHEKIKHDVKKDAKKTPILSSGVIYEIKTKKKNINYIFFTIQIISKRNKTTGSRMGIIEDIKFYYTNINRTTWWKIRKNVHITINMSTNYWWAYINIKDNA